MAFKPGESGNPAGRPKGARDKKNAVAAEFAKEGSAVARVVLDAAKGGDMQAAALVLQRLSPPLRPTASTVQFELDADAPIGDQAKQIVLAVSRGEIDPDTGKLLIDMLSAFVGLHDIEALIIEVKAQREALTRVRGGVLEMTTP